MIYTNVSGTYTALATNKFIYYGWNLVAVLDATNRVLRTFCWGLDLSGTLQGAGGVGGLLAVKDSSETLATNFFYVYDGYGNVTRLVNSKDGSEAAEYEYGPFGESIRAIGPMSKQNPIRFSTKYIDDQIAFAYYGYRNYDVPTGRWFSRDPIGESGGKNLYSFSGNDSLNKFDILGLQPNVNMLTFELIFHYIYGGGEDLRKTGGDWAEFLSSHPSVKNALDAQYNSFRKKVSYCCDYRRKPYTIRSDRPIIQDNDFLILTLNQGHVSQSGTYIVDCRSKTITFTPDETTYWDEVIWKNKGWVDPTWNTYQGWDIVPGYLFSWIGYVGSLTPGGVAGTAPTFGQYYFQVNWFGGRSIKRPL